MKIAFSAMSDAELERFIQDAAAERDRRAELKVKYGHLIGRSMTTSEAIAELGGDRDLWRNAVTYGHVKLIRPGRRGRGGASTIDAYSAAVYLDLQERKGKKTLAA